MEQLNTALAVVGTTLLVLGLSSGFVKNRWFLSEPVLALAAGVLVGPAVMDWLDLGLWGDPVIILEEAARFTVAMALVDVALSLPNHYPRSRVRSLAALLGLVMPGMWLVSSTLAWLLLDLGPVPAMLLGAVITPTDPVMASSIVSGSLAERYVPAPLRDALRAESGANDALALPLVMLPVVILTHEGPVLGYWLLHSVLLEVGVGIAVGIAAGLGTRFAMTWVQGRSESEQTSLLTVSLALAIALLGMVKLLQSDGLLAAFVAGLVINRGVSGELEEQKQLLHEGIQRFFEMPVFVLLGMALPWAAWLEGGWLLAAFVGAVLLLRRLPVLLAARYAIEPMRPTNNALFAGWFGPIGIAALYYAMVAVEKTGDYEVWGAASLVIAVSAVVHGVTATPFTRWYGRRNRRNEQPS